MRPQVSFRVAKTNLPHFRKLLTKMASSKNLRKQAAAEHVALLWGGRTGSVSLPDGPYLGWLFKEAWLGRDGGNKARDQFLLRLGQAIRRQSAYGALVKTK